MNSKLLIFAFSAVLAFGTAKLPAQDCEAHRTQILAGQTMHAADVEVTATETDLIIQINTVDDWLLREVHIFAGTGPLPLNGGGNPPPGQFPYATHYPAPGASEHTETIPLADLGVDCGGQLNIAIHTVVERSSVSGGEGTSSSETGWAFGDKTWPGNRWGWYFCYDVCCESECMTLTGPEPCRAGEPNTLSVSNATPGSQVGFFWGTMAGTRNLDIHACLGAEINILDPRTLGKDVADGNGDASKTFNVPARVVGRTAYFQSIELDTCCISNAVDCTFQ